MAHQVIPIRRYALGKRTLESCLVRSNDPSLVIPRRARTSPHDSGTAYSSEANVPGAPAYPSPHGGCHSRWDIGTDIPLGIAHAVAAAVREGAFVQEGRLSVSRVGDAKTIHEGSVLEAVDIVRVTPWAPELGGRVDAWVEEHTAGAVGRGLQAEEGIGRGLDGSVDAYASADEVARVEVRDGLGIWIGSGHGEGHGGAKGDGEETGNGLGWDVSGDSGDSFVTGTYLHVVRGCLQDFSRLCFKVVVEKKR